MLKYLEEKVIMIGVTILSEGKSLNQSTGTLDLLNPDGSVKQRRYYGNDGHAIEDIDYNHTDDGTHTFPHRHEWDWTKFPPRQ